MKIALAFALLVAISGTFGCNRSDPPAARTAVTQETFAPVYRAAKTVQGATGPGVTYLKFSELLQDLSTEVGIAKDHQLNDMDRDLIQLYEQALDEYKFSATLWSLKIQASGDAYHGEIPVSFHGEIPSDIAPLMARFELTPEPRTMRYTDAKYGVLPASTIQLMWQRADQTLSRATNLYYGRPADSGAAVIK